MFLNSKVLIDFLRRSFAMFVNTKACTCFVQNKWRTYLLQNKTNY